ncbi:MAG: hypothetical protein JWL77_5815 [Chthonomonadaceae bacterium]|nr:hypothetical protein [Chthonomonadaceae bacterium]
MRDWIADNYFDLILAAVGDSFRRGRGDYIADKRCLPGGNDDIRDGIGTVLRRVGGLSTKTNGCADDGQAVCAGDGALDCTRTVGLSYDRGRASSAAACQGDEAKQTET